MSAAPEQGSPTRPAAHEAGREPILPESRWPRWHLAEIEDQPWLPCGFRAYLTDFLRALFSIFLDHTPVVDRLADLLERTGERRLVDLCSGSSGPLARVVDRLVVEHDLDVTATLTDLYPNHQCFESLRGASGGRIDGIDSPIDARHVPAELDGVRTLFSGLHHFTPSDARAILADAARHGRPIAIFEVSERHPRLLPVLPLLPLAVFALTPWLKPRTLPRLLLTYVVPVVPILVFWDGLVSCCRTYTVAELDALVAEIDVEGYRFEAGQDRVRGLPARVTWLLGRPATEPET